MLDGCNLHAKLAILKPVIYQSIEAIIEPLLANNQYGFRKKRSTLDVVNLAHKIAKDTIAEIRWKGDTKKYCLVTTWNIGNVFNSANWECIKRAFEEKNVSGYRRRIVASYFIYTLLKYD